jgi:hypothetical protein
MVTVKDIRGYYQNGTLRFANDALRSFNDSPFNRNAPNMHHPPEPSIYFQDRIFKDAMSF